MSYYTDACMAISHITDVDELRKLNTLVITNINDANRRLKFSFRCGDRVEFTSNKNHGAKGTVIDIMTKNVSVRDDNGTKWRVSPSLLRKI